MDMKLPPGQRAIADFPRFGLDQFARRFPPETARIEIRCSGAVASEVLLADALQNLPRVEQISDFHCVTTWSKRGLRWGGVRFADFYEQVIVPRAQPQPEAACVILRGQDGARTSMLLADLLAPDVLLADTLDGAPLPLAHGAPLRLVAPAHYGYKSVKHLSRLEFRRDDHGFRASGLRFMQHPRARVAWEERGRWFPGWFLRYLYRPLIGGTVKRFARALDEYEQNRRA